MMAVTKSLVFITCLCFARDFVFCDDYEEIGKDITLTPSIRGKPTEILWKHNENMVLVYDGSEVVVHSSFRRRVVVDFETGQLTIKKLTSQDSGQYQSEIVINGKVQTSSHTVTVLDILPEPQVTCELEDTSNVKKLLCSVESRTQPSYEWSGPTINVQSGPELLVEEQEENRDSVYTCTVKNQANSRSTDFTLRDCHRGSAGTAVFVPVIIVAILLIILLILLGVFLYRRKEKSRQSGLRKMDPENGEGHSLLRKYQKDAMPGSSEATLPSHARLPSQNQSIIDKKWDQDSGAESSRETDEGQKLLKETKKLQEQTLKESPQSAVPETKVVTVQEQEDGQGQMAEERNHDPETQSCKQTDSDSAIISVSQRLGHDDELSRRDEEVQTETLEQSPQSAVSETNQEDTGNGNEGELDTNVKNSKHAVEEEENTYSKPDETEKERHEQRQEEEEKEKSPKQESGNEEKFPEHQNEREELKTEGNSEDNQTPGETEEKKERDTETVSPQSAVTERNNMDTENEAEQRNKNEKKSQSDEGEQSVEQQNESMRNQRTKDAAEEDMRPGEEEEGSEEESPDGIDRANTAQACDPPAVDPLSDALSSPADSPANLEKKPINSSDSSSNQTDRSNYTDQDREERKRPGQEQEDGQEQMAEERNHDPETQSCKQTDSDSAIISVSQRLGHDDELSRRDEEVRTETLEQSPQSAVSETNQEDTGNGNEGELDTNVKNSKHAVEEEENTYSKPDETEKERHEQRQEEEEKEKSPKQESGNEEKFPEHQNEREELKTEGNSEDNQTPGETEEKKERDTVTDSPANLEKKPINSSDSSSNQTDQDQEVRKLSGSELDEEEKVGTNQEQMAEEKNPEPQTSEEQSCSNTDKQDKQTDSDTAIKLGDGLRKQDEEVPKNLRGLEKAKALN
ncbi:uncharacterized protein LOC143747319 isoform X2 [Siphateles boraxobius]|uniref:uncharacterized protein LOC143747319 isoform X2 n=1 Tax=Siphateles boraxobius TaxID=180520 RepID=UPI004064591B